MRNLLILALLVGLGSCGGGPNPPEPPEPPPVEPPYTEACQALLDQGLPWCHEAGMECGACVHNPSSDPKHCEMAPKCPEPPPVEPPEPPEPGNCLFFPQGVPESDFTGGEASSILGTQVNAAIERVTRCPVGTDCITGMGADEFFGKVNSELRSTGLWAGRHKDSPPGASDEIAVAVDCKGWWESYHIYNYGGGKVVWSPGSARPKWRIDPKWCPTDCSSPEPPSGECPLPHPNVAKMKFTQSEKGSHLDTTWITVGQPEFCASIGYCCMPGTGTPPNTCDSPGCIPRGGCPVRGDGNPIRPVCEQELCDQKWECNGQPYPPYKGNPAQTDCRGHWKTYCANAPTTAEGDR